MDQRHARERFADVPHLGLRRAQELAPHRRVVEQLPDFDRRAHRAAAGRDRRGMPAGDLPVRAAASTSRVRLRSVSRLTSAIDASASPRKPSDATRNRSSASWILLVAWLATASGKLIGGNAAAVVADAHQFQPALLHRTSIRVAPASMEFSINSLTTLAGRSITSPAAILLTTLGDSWRM